MARDKSSKAKKKSTAKKKTAFLRRSNASRKPKKKDIFPVKKT